jgi:prevent-host-death family protein
MNTEIGSFEAKTRLPELLRSVKRGHRYTITLRGKPIAELVPGDSASNLKPAAAVESMRSIRKVTGVPNETLNEWIREGRR